MRLKPQRTYDLKLDFYFLSLITPSLSAHSSPAPSQSIDWCMAVEGIGFFLLEFRGMRTMTYTVSLILFLSRFNYSPCNK